MVEFRKREYKGVVYNEVFLDGKPMKMGEDAAIIQDIDCGIHGKNIGLFASNQGGHDGVEICLKCCEKVIEILMINPNWRPV